MNPKPCVRKLTPELILSVCNCPKAPKGRSLDLLEALEGFQASTTLWVVCDGLRGVGAGDLRGVAGWLD